MSTDRSLDASSRTLRQRLYGLGFVDEFGPIYALYTILFLDNGITAAQISTVFVLWALIEIAFEIPSGALADLVDRRKLLAFAFVLRAIGIAVWLIEPSYAGVIAGAALWSLHQSLASGAWEAMIHDELTAIGEADSYARTMARMEQSSATGITLGALAATGLVAVGATLTQLGWITVALHGISIALVLSLPDVRWVARADADADAYADSGTEDSADELTALDEWRQTLRDGIRFAWRTPVVLRLIMLGALIEGLYIFDDYVPVLADERGASPTVIPIFVAIIFVGLIIGDEIVARQPHLSGLTIGIGLCIGAVALAVAALTTSMWPLLLVGVGYGAQEVVWMISDARFQERVPASKRATVTSVRSFFAGIVSIIALAIVTALSTSELSVWALTGIAAVLFVAGVLSTRWIPAHTSARSND